MPSLVLANLRSRLAPSRSFLSRLGAHLALSRSRRALERLDDHLLQDIGLTREEARSEAGRPVWDVPLHWRA